MQKVISILMTEKVMTPPVEGDKYLAIIVQMENTHRYVVVNDPVAGKLDTTELGYALIALGQKIMQAE